MNIRHVILGVSALAIAGFGIISVQQQVAAGGCYMPRVSMGGTAEPSSAVYMRSMPCMEEGDRLNVVRPGEVLTILEYSDGWYKLKRDNGEIGRVYSKNRLKNINSYETSEKVTPTKTTTTTKPSLVKKSVLSTLKLKKSLANIKKNYSEEKITTIIEQFTEIKTETPELTDLANYVIDGLK